MTKLINEKYDFQVSSDGEEYKKVMEAKNDYENGGVTYSIDESYTNFLKYVNSKKKTNV
jgi:hypothetical protein